MTLRYHIINIRKLLVEGFTAEELRRLCYENPDFRPVYDQLAVNTGKTEIAQRLLEYAERQLLIESLLDIVEESNPSRYKQHQPYHIEPDKNSSLETTERPDQTAPQPRSKDLLLNKLRDPVWQGIGGIVAILALCWSIYSVFIQPSSPAPTPGAPVSTPTPSPTSTTDLLPSSTLVVTDTPISLSPPAAHGSTPSLNRYGGQLAIPLISGFDTKVYLTGFDGKGINGPAPVSLTAQQPMFSWDGRSLLIKATIEGISGIHKLTASGFSPELSIPRSSAEWPVLSPDGQTVMFSETTLESRLHIKRPDETTEELLLNSHPIFAENLLWSEANQLIFQGCATWLDEPDTCGVWVTGVNNLDPRRIVDHKEAYPMSARAGWLAYMVKDGEDWEIYLIPLVGGAAVNLTDNNDEDGWPVIAPGGNGLAYLSDTSGAWGLWTMDLDGQNKRWMFDIDPTRGTVDLVQWQRERMSWRR
ncbi:MAG: PD40 domain-containing protein [Anaerolineae bacterium]|nr:PD40 domain-containing protein [Anaerolineae bacterium]